jgi:hypothetical protein
LLPSCVMEVQTAMAANLILELEQRLQQSFMMLSSAKSLCLINEATGHRENGGVAPPFLISALKGGWSASRPGGFTPRKRTPGTHWSGAWNLNGTKT